MADVLIRDVPEHVLKAIDAAARRLGLSRSEYLRRRLATLGGEGPVTTDDLERFAQAFSDLGDPEVIRRAWE
jgi:hypothetical protein